ncbi:DUF3429 domain-containing protein [Rhodoblastus sp.]|jgi:hypothetical protein|uniref:DUF3429 domain-containing protein n=1 Tax=Rhodoblastus sp. TaxID=1962975 RepID=UPI0025D694DE|nr:DUF3429 domain-containing protein [Rhodoblastus sp.]
MAREATPAAVRAYGLLGLIPFLLPPVIAWVRPQSAQLILALEAHYAALILSFLGGVRWAMEARKPAPDAGVIGLSMIPTLVALTLLELPVLSPSQRLFGLALALAAHWAWDLMSADAPPWFPGLRTTLSVGAVAGLIAAGLALV